MLSLTSTRLAPRAAAMAAYNGPPLSRSALHSIVVDGAADLRPVLQVADWYPANQLGGICVRLSDGEHSYLAMLVGQGLYDLAKRRAGRNTVVRVNECVARRDGWRTRGSRVDGHFSLLFR